jgi:Cft2 family RNA processing exonuclease
MTFRNAGHILGSASVALEIAEGLGSEKKVTTLAFTGDLGRKGAAVVQDPETIERADVLITESTYGGRSHGPMNEARKNLARVVSQTANNGGLLIIPAFAVGRTQDVVYHLHELMESKEIPSMPVYVDSPLATNITEIFRQHPECFDEETEQLLMQDGGGDPFGFYMLKYTRSTEESKKLNDIRRPAIIISASGMCEGGRVLHHLRRNTAIPRPRFSSWDSRPKILWAESSCGETKLPAYTERSTRSGPGWRRSTATALMPTRESCLISSSPSLTSRSMFLWCMASRMQPLPWPQGWRDRESRM